VFVLTQALDNQSADQCVLDGEIFDARSIEAGPNLERLSEVLRTGIRFQSGATDFSRDHDDIAIKAATSDLDSAGRPSPVLILIRQPEFTSPQAVCDLATTSAALLGRSVEARVLLRDLESWLRSPKAASGPLARWGRRIRAIGRELWRKLINRLRP
jgi:hypothetical protein